MKMDFSKGTDGLIPAVVQDRSTRQILMVGWMNEAALTETRRTSEVVFYSRSKKRLWKKGETSGNVLRVRSIAADCDADTILIQADPAGPACHTGAYSCFGETRSPGLEFLLELQRTIDSRLATGAEGSYVAKLAKDGIPRMAQKVGEEGVEVALAAGGEDGRKVVSEGADLLFHLRVLLRAKGSSIEALAAELENRSR